MNRIVGDVTAGLGGKRTYDVVRKSKKNAHRKWQAPIDRFRCVYGSDDWRAPGPTEL